MQFAGVEHERAQPRRTEQILIADDRVPIIVVRSKSGGRQGGLLYQRVAREVTVFGSAPEPLRFGRLRPIEADGADVIAERDWHVLRNCDRAHSRAEAFRSELRECVELCRAGRAVGDAGVLVNVFQRREEPEFVFDEWSADCADIVLPREGLLRIGRRILNGEAGVKIGRAFIECAVAVPLVAAAAGRDDDGSGRCAAGVGIFLCGADGEFLDRVGRKILQESADVIVGVVAAVDGEFVVQA